MKIPYLRSKAEAVIAKSGFNPGDHSGKALINVLEILSARRAVPGAGADRCASMPKRSWRWSSGRACARWCASTSSTASSRSSSSCRATATTAVVREKIGDYLKTVFEGRLSAYYPAFPEGGLARVHFIIGRSGGKTPKVEQATLEAAIRDIVRTWEDALARGGRRGRRRSAASRHRLAISRKAIAAASRRPRRWPTPGASPSSMPPNPIAIDYYRHADQRPTQAALKIYHFGAPVALSRRVPVLENMGFRVISERTFEVGAEAAGTVFIHDMELDNAFGKPIDLADGGALFEDVFLAVWRGDVDNDGYNALAQTAGLWSREIAILRAYGRYLQQAGIPQSQGFIAAALNRYPEIARGAVHAVRRRASIRPRRSEADGRRPSISRPRSRMRWRTCRTSTTTPSSGATST